MAYTGEFAKCITYCFACKALSALHAAVLITFIDDCVIID